MGHPNAILRYVGVLVVIMAAQVTVLPNGMAYEKTRTELGVRLRLTSLPVRVRLDTPVPGISDGGRAAVLRAISSWNARACSSPLFVLTEDDDNVSIEVISVVDGWKYGRAIAAHTVVDNDPYLGDIRHVIIEIDGRRKWSQDADVAADALDLESILLHELGHSVGLDHSRNSAAAMRAGIKPGQARRDLHEDDLSGVCDVIKYSYPKNLGSLANIARMTKWSPWFLVLVFMFCAGWMIVGIVSLERLWMRFWLPKMR